MSKPIAYFGGQIVTSAKGILMFSLLALSGFIIFDQVKNVTHPFVIFLLCYLPVAAILLCYYGLQMYYFGISGKLLIIRNHVFFWHFRSIPLAEIESVRIDTDTLTAWGKEYSPYYLRVFLGSLKTRKFFAATLSGKKWSQLTEALEQRNIRVVNTHPYVPFKEMM